MQATPTSGTPDERSLAQRAQRGEVDAFETLYRAHVPRVFAVCLRMCGERVRAGELTQDVFVHAWERLASFRGEAAFGSWLHRLAVNVVLTSLRAERRRTTRVALGDDGPDAAWEERGGDMRDPDGTETRIDLERAIASLPPGARTVFVLHDIEGYRHDEIARLTGTAAGTMRAQLHRARKLLMERLSR